MRLLLKFVLFAATLPLALSGCPKKAEKPEDELLAAAKGHLAERERKLSAYQLEGTVLQPPPAHRQADADGGTEPAEARFEVAYRAPNRMKGTVTIGSERHTFVFDGERLGQLHHGQKRLIEFELNRPKEEVALFLTQLFGSMIPEGYRVPVLDLKTASARRTTHPLAQEAVELSSQAQDEAGQRVRVTYVLRWPSMDLLEKRLETGGNTLTLAVTEEHCDARLKLCVPKKLVQRAGDAEGASTTVSKISLGDALPVEAFKVVTPEGYEATKMPLPTAPAR